MIVFTCTTSFYRPTLLGVVFLLLWLPAVASSDSVALDSFLDQVEKRAADVNSFSCNFRQERHLSIFPEPVIFSGRLLLQRPQRLRWEFSDPIPSVLILNDSAGIKCDPGGAKISFRLDQDPVMRLVARQLWSWTSGSYREMADDFHLTVSAGPVLILTPVKGGINSFIRSIRVSFDPETLQPAEVTIEEPGGDRTELIFSGYKLNIQLPPGVFSDCPAGNESALKE